MPGMLRSQVARAQRGLRLYQGGQLAVDLREGRGQRGGHRVEAQVQVGAGVVATLPLGRATLHQLATPAAQVLEVLDRGAGLGAPRGPHLGRAAGQPAGIEAVGRGQHAVGAGEGAGLARIDPDHRQAGRGQRGHHDPLVAATGLQHDATGPSRLELPLQAPQAAPRARHRPGRARGLYRDVQPGFRHIDPDRDVRGSRHWVPSTTAGLTPCLANAGSWSRPRDLFGLRASVRAGTTLLSYGLQRPRSDRSVPARARSPWEIQGVGNIQEVRKRKSLAGTSGWFDTGGWVHRLGSPGIGRELWLRGKLLCGLGRLRAGMPLPLERVKRGGRCEGATWGGGGGDRVGCERRARSGGEGRG